MEEFENKEQVEKKASGIDAEYDELDQLCQDIKERMEDVSSREEAESAKKKAVRKSSKHEADGNGNCCRKLEKEEHTG